MNGSSSRSSEIGQLPRCNQGKETQTRYLDLFSFLTLDYHGPNEFYTWAEQNGYTSKIEKKKHVDFIKKLKESRYQAKIMSAKLGAGGCLRSPGYDSLSDRSMCGNQKIKALQVLDVAETNEKSS